MSERTQESYLRAVRKLAAYLRKSPDIIDEEELRAYFFYIRNDQLWEPSSIRVAYSGIKFFYSHTCPRDWACACKKLLTCKLQTSTAIACSCISDVAKVTRIA